MSSGRILIYLLLCVIAVSAGLVLHLGLTRSVSDDYAVVKRSFVQLTGLPDLAVTTAAGHIRHRSISHANMVFYAGPDVRGFFPSDFVYAPSDVLNVTHSGMKEGMDE